MRVTEIFCSVQGETTQAGRPCAFVRFTGCDLRCQYCDTAYAFSGGEQMSRNEILARLSDFPTRFVTLTGGEPMLQKELPDLCRDLLGVGYEVSIETHGQLPTDALPEQVARIFDVKTPGSGEVTRDFNYLHHLRPGDEVKFVICSEADFRWSVDVIRTHQLEGRTPILISPAHGRIDPKDLVRWMLETGLQARLNLQIHKYIWGDAARGV
jgi:7-carboxy-7-deazaguanine synthase